MRLSNGVDTLFFLPGFGIPVLWSLSGHTRHSAWTNSGPWFHFRFVFWTKSIIPLWRNTALNQGTGNNRTFKIVSGRFFIPQYNCGNEISGSSTGNGSERKGRGMKTFTNEKEIATIVSRMHGSVKKRLLEFRPTIREKRVPWLLIISSSVKISGQNDWPLSSLEKHIKMVGAHGSST